MRKLLLTNLVRHLEHEVAMPHMGARALGDDDAVTGGEQRLGGGEAIF